MHDRPPRIRTAIWDIETDGLLHQLTRVHCLVIRDYERGLVYRFRSNDDEETIHEGVALLLEADVIVGHNIVAFDIPALEKIFGKLDFQGKIRDTLVMARVVFSDQKDRDFRLWEKGTLPGKYIGQHKLEAWGHRLGVQKGEYSDIMEKEAKERGLTDLVDIHRYVWGSWNERMDDYCDLDVTVTTFLWQKIEKQQLDPRAIRLEHTVHMIMAEQERNGWPFDRPAAEKLADDLDREANRLATLAQQHYGVWYAPDKKRVIMPLWDPDETQIKRKARKSGKAKKDKVYLDPRPEFGEDDSRAVWAEVSIPKKSINYKDPLKASVTEGAPYCKVKRVEFNPTSRQHIVDRFVTVYDWEPVVFTDSKAPAVDDTVLNGLVERIPMARELAEVFYHKKRLGQIRDGKNAWLKMVAEDGAIHHYCAPVDTAQALTRSGWKFRHELSIGEEILAYDASDGLKKWTPIQSFADHTASQLFRVYNKSAFSVEVTSDHRWFVRQRVGRNRVYKNEVRRTFELNSESAIITNAPFDTREDSNGHGTPLLRLKRSTTWVARVLSMSQAERQAFLEGFLIADGYCHEPSKSWRWSQNEGDLAEAALTASFLVNDGFVHATWRKGTNYRMMMGVLNIEPFIHVKALSLCESRVADVWCPNTALGSWVMRQGNCITITGNCNVGGTLTGRASHVGPNLAQVPRVVIKKVDGKSVLFKGREGKHGWDCRNLFISRWDWPIVGCDLEGIELRCLAEMLRPFDDGEYIDVILTRDIHTYNQEAAGLDSRDKAKTFIYALVYGAGDVKLGSIVAPGAKEDEQREIGERLRQEFLANLKGFRQVMSQIKRWARTGFVPGLDGRRLPVRSAHSALNTKLQSDAALIAKQWVVNYYETLVDEYGFTHGWDGDFAHLAWVHDETQVACKPEHVDVLKKVSVEAAAQAGIQLGFHIPVAASPKVGFTWAQTH